MLRLAVFLIFLLATNKSLAAEGKTAMDKTRGVVAAELSAFAQTKDLDALRNAAAAIDAIPLSPDNTHFPETRREKLSLWLTLMNRIDKEIDPKFDPADVPALSVAPPEIPGGALDSGMDPKDISDPVVRRQYEDAVLENKKKAERYSLQIKLRKSSDSFQRRIQEFVLNSYAKTQADAAEVKRLIEQHIESPDRAANLRALCLE